MNIFSRKVVGSVVSLAAVLSTQAWAVTKDVKVGVILPLTGDAATFGTESQNGLKLALEKITTAPKITLVIEDTQGTPKGSAAAINKLITTDKVAVVIGEVKSSDTLAAAPIAQDAKIPLMTHASTNDTITLNKSFISRICFVDSFQGTVMARFALEKLSAKKAMILVDSDSDYSRGLRDSFKAAFEKGGGKIAAEVSYSAKDTDFTAQLTRVRKEKPEVVWIPGYYGNVGAILRQAKELGIKAKMLGGDGWDSADLFKIAGPAAAGHYISSHFAPDDSDAKVQAFVKEYKAKFNEVPGAMAALGYDAGLFIHKAVIAANSNEPSKIAAAIAGMKNFDGVTGKISLDANRNAIKPAVILETTQTGFKFNSRINP